MEDILPSKKQVYVLDTPYGFRYDKSRKKYSDPNTDYHLISCLDALRGRDPQALVLVSPRNPLPPEDMKAVRALFSNVEDVYKTFRVYYSAVGESAPNQWQREEVQAENRDHAWSISKYDRGRYVLRSIRQVKKKEK